MALLTSNPYIWLLIDSISISHMHASSELIRFIMQNMKSFILEKYNTRFAEWPLMVRPPQGFFLCFMVILLNLIWILLNLTELRLNFV